MRVLELKQRGGKQRAIAAALGVTEGAVSQGWTAARRGGQDALRSRTDRRGATPQLTPGQRRLIPHFLWHGPEAYGFWGTSGPGTGSPQSSRRSSVSRPARARCPAC
jgi:transposase